MTRDLEPMRRLVALSLAALPLCLALAARGADLTLTAEQERALEIVTAAPQRWGGAEISGLAGQVMIPNRQLRVVAAPVAGLLEAMAVAVGDPVRRGQTLARLRSPTLAEGRSGLVQAGIQARLAQEALDRDEKLWREGIIAESRYRATQARAAEAAAVLEEKRQALLLAGVPPGGVERMATPGAGDSTLVLASPIDGVVLEQLASVGERVEAAAPVYRLARLEPLWLEIHVPLARIGGVKEGAAVSVPAAGASGRVINVGRSVDPASQTVSLRALIDVNAAALRPGQVVEASVRGAADGPAQWRLPAAAVVRRGGAALVFVRTRGGFRAQTVTVVSEGAEGIVVRGGIGPDDAVAVQGVSALKAQLAESGGQ